MNISLCYSRFVMVRRFFGPADGGHLDDGQVGLDGRARFGPEDTVLQGKLWSECVSSYARKYKF